MKIQFIYMGSENLGLEYLSAAVKKSGHHASLTFDPALFYDKHYLNIDRLAKIFDAREAIACRALSNDPDIIGFSVFTHNYQWALSIARLIKKRKNIPVIFGGIHPTILPEEVLNNDCVDMVCIGEGEEALVRLLDTLRQENKTVDNIWFKDKEMIIKNPLRRLNDDLDSLPFPDKSLFDGKADMKEKYMIMTSRGCPFDCSYCSISTLRDIYVGKGPFLRFRSPESVLEEIIEARKQRKFKSVDFHDDVFTINYEKMKELLSGYKSKVNLPYTCLSHPLYMDREKARLLKDTGCCMVHFGIQSMSESLRSSVLNRQEKNTDIERALESCREVDLPFQVDHIFGIPGDSEQILIDAAKFYAEYRPQKIGCFWLSYFPKTAIIQTALASGSIGEDDIKVINDGLGKILHFGGSVNDTAQKEMIKNFEVLFKLIPLLPRKAIEKIISEKWYRKLSHIPFFIILAIDVIAGIRYRSYHSFSYMRYYLKHIARHFLSFSLKCRTSLSYMKDE